MILFTGTGASEMIWIRAMRRTVVIGWAIGMLWHVNPIHAAVRWVPDDYSNIQAAVDAAEEGDEVVVRDGTWQATGFSNIRFYGKAITVRSQNGWENCRIWGWGSQAFIFDHNESEAAVLAGFEIGYFQTGPAVIISNAAPVIADCRFIGNVGRMSGGALYASGARITLIGNEFVYNHGGFDGGAIGTWETTGIIADCVFDSNRNDDCGIDAYGGALAAWKSAIDFTNCLFVNNIAVACEYTVYEALGGAMFLDGYEQSEPFRLINCTIYGNGIEGLGSYPGIYSNGPVEMRSCIIWNNDPSHYGSGTDIQYCILPQAFPGDGNLVADPQFHAPDQNDFYLDIDSPAIDSGHAASSDVCFDKLEWEVCLNSYWSLLSIMPDGGIVDRGYHYSRPNAAKPTPTPTTGPGTPTNTPYVTKTPTPTFTPYSPTLTPTPIFTPYPPTLTSTPTPDGYSETGVSIHMPSDVFHPGDLCGCTATVCNAEDSALNGYPLFVILEIAGTYYFAPSFGSFDNYLDEHPDFAPGKTSVVVLPAFEWPEGAGSFSGCIWYGALTNPQLTDLFGTLGTWSFGWSQ